MRFLHITKKELCGIYSSQLGEGNRQHHSCTYRLHLSAGSPHCHRLEHHADKHHNRVEFAHLWLVTRHVSENHVLNTLRHSPSASKVSPSTRRFLCILLRIRCASSSSSSSVPKSSSSDFKKASMPSSSSSLPSSSRKDVSASSSSASPSSSSTSLPERGYQCCRDSNIEAADLFLAS